MSEIQVMPLSLSNQIAAGEVVERPSSVVKELVENALDAGASQIDIRVEEAGLLRIEVTDNGSGIPSDQVALAFERHATSKLHEKEDLFRIRSLGFRGEALPSVASVSELTIETSTGTSAGVHLKVKGGEILEQSAAPSRQGTTIVVEHLFYNTPARLKYIKTPQTEMAHISDLINRFSFSYPSVAFRLLSDGNPVLRTAGNGDLRQAIAGVYGVSTAKKMIEIEAENFNYQMEGFISPPDLTRASNKYITLILNNRVIRNFKLSRAIEKGYGSKLMVNRRPIAVIHIKTDPLLLDVNVHPTKQQVRISEEDELADLMTQAVRESIQTSERIPKALDNIRANQQTQREEKSQQTALDFSPENLDRSRAAAVDQLNEETQPLDFNAGPFFKEDENSLFDLHDESPLVTAKKRIKQEEEKQATPFPDLEYFGQMHGTYLFAQSGEGLYIIDQHAAQERIKYEEYRVEIGKEDNLQQQLLVPVLLHYPHDEFLLIKEHRDELNEVGLYLEDFGDQTYIVHSHPAWFQSDEVESTLREMIDFFIENKGISLAEFREATAIMMSCKRSIKANHHLENEEARQLLVDLAQCDNPYNCPHGRPVLVHLTNSDMEKMFKRIQD